MAFTNLLLASGQSVSSVAIVRGARGIIFGVASVANQVGIAFATDSSQQQFSPLMKYDGSGQRFLVTSGGTAAVAMLNSTPTPYLRLECVGGTWAATTSAFVVDAATM